VERTGEDEDDKLIRVAARSRIGVRCRLRRWSTTFSVTNILYNALTDSCFYFLSLMNISLYRKLRRLKILSLCTRQIGWKYWSRPLP
jgi:hypothetical protein